MPTQILCLSRATSLCTLFFLVASALVIFSYNEKSGAWILNNFTNQIQSALMVNCSNFETTRCKTSTFQSNAKEMDSCKNQCRPSGSERLPRGIVEQTSNFEMTTFSGDAIRKENANSDKILLAVPVGIKQKDVVDRMVKKFMITDCTVVLFHYDGFVDEWKDLEWSKMALHISAPSQTKWWFAKRFLHPDIVADYDYIFPWDEDLDLENFNPQRYLEIVKREGLEVSQPALDPEKSDIHQAITSRSLKGDVHRRVEKVDNKSCFENSTGPPCTGWVEIMAPVFSRTAWRCLWFMIQNDLIHGWALDWNSGYCAQGDRRKNVGVVDSEYLIHKGFSTLGRLGIHKVNHDDAQMKERKAIRERSLFEAGELIRRWREAAADDKCWYDPYADSN